MGTKRGQILESTRVNISGWSRSRREEIAESLRQSIYELHLGGASNRYLNHLASAARAILSRDWLTRKQHGDAIAFHKILQKRESAYQLFG